MNVTLEIPDDLGRKAGHRAVDEAKTLSTWIVDLVAAELQGAVPPPVDLLAALGDESLAEDDLPLPDRRSMTFRPVEFP